MQAFFILLGALAVIIPGCFIVSLFLPATVKVVRVRVIPATPAAVFQQLNIVHNWENWSPWHQIDSHMKLLYTDTESGVGAAYSWESENRQIGKGAMMITNSRQDEFIATDMHFMEQRLAKATFKLEPVAGGTTVTWTMTAELGHNPFKKFMGLLMDKWVGKDFEKGLANLEAVLTNKQLSFEK
ncbi:SRPBCC family protein [Chitinophaga sancti]|uniref:Polyketide cyclase / dehydrase and lipid transport n=1 Tax=Chitinophaga sancti TaxID=1004 RepID=A0A1K1RRA9_9BACT|nr:SRPBCC family protein [Chitinophaga sancti]WQD62491.1 SRPBCC family protein [Chitinophaga sancti]WQG91940.1 SRPBCC family protein [Chitinophaga sancti]SFW74316.1 Polyketide cyclase / dehydrase and lipid transport [Chitinophaga sancti]